jgi:hypothetical protein
MTGFTPFVAGNVLTAANLNALLPVYVIKQATETVTNSSTLQNDDELVLSLPTGRVYHIRCVLICGITAAQDIKTAWSTTNVTHVGSRSCRGPGVSTAGVGDTTMRSSGGHALTTAVSYGLDGTSTSYIDEEFIVSTSGTGTVQLQWAQNAASAATSATVVSGSYIIATPIS